MTTILVTGANGQLGSCIRDIAPTCEGLSFVFTTKEVFDISNKQLVQDYFSNKNFDYCINTAAYTNVEQAEKDADNAFKINAEGAKNLAEVCAENKQNYYTFLQTTCLTEKKKALIMKQISPIQ